MGLADSDNVLDNVYLPISTRTEHNVGKFAPKPGSKLKKTISKNTKEYSTSSSVKENLGQNAIIAKSDADAVAVSTKINPVQLVGEKEEVSRVIPEQVSVKQSDKVQPKAALVSKRSKNKSVSFNLPDETEKSPSHEQGVESLNFHTTLERDGDDFFNRGYSSVKTANEHAEFLEIMEEFEPIDDIMDIDSWDEPSIPTELEIDGADKSKTLGGPIKRNSTKRTFENENHFNDDSGDIGDLNESNNSDEGVTWAPSDTIDTMKTSKRKRNFFEESDSRKTLEPKKRIPHGTRRKRRQGTDDTSEKPNIKAIRDFKTNFGMMASLFPGRTPRQLKAKFKAEERRHPVELRDALDFHSKDHTLFDKVIQAMKDQKEAEDAAANTEEEIDQCEKEGAATESNHKADNSENDLWNDGDFDFNESADLELDVNVSSAPEKEEKTDTEKEVAENNFGGEVNNSDKKDLWDEDFELFDDLKSETGAVSLPSDEKLDESC